MEEEMIEEPIEEKEQPTERLPEDIPLRELLGEEFIGQLDEYLIKFCKAVRKNLKQERDEVIAITAYPGTGKSQLTALMGCLIDKKYTFKKNISFIPTSKDIKDLYLNLPMYSVLHIDEASRGLHKHKWHDKLQQTLNELYDTDREGHYLCSVLDMPRFTDFTEKFRNFRISWHIWIVERGVAIVYKKDLDKDIDDPWHTKESIKMKQKYWRNKKLYERSISEIVRLEQKTPNYCFYFKWPKLPDNVWKIYQDMKKQSRIQKAEIDDELETKKDVLDKERMDRMKEVKAYALQGLNNNEIGIKLGLAASTISTWKGKIRAYEKLKGKIELPQPGGGRSLSLEANPIPISITNRERDKFTEIKEEGEERAESSTLNGSME